jgi:hypothetical protein
MPDASGAQGCGLHDHSDPGLSSINTVNSTETSNEANNDTSLRDNDIVTMVHPEYEVE